MNKKVTCTRVRPNPMFEDWLSYIYEDAKKTNSHLEDMLKEALESLMKYPLPLKSGAECIILKGFNKILCKYLDRLLNEHNNNGSERANGSDNALTTTSPVSSKKNGDSSNNNGSEVSASALIANGSDNSLTAKSPVSSKKDKDNCNNNGSSSAGALIANVSDNSLITTSPVPSKKDEDSSKCVARDKQLRLELTRLPDLSASLRSTNSSGTPSTGKGKGKGKRGGKMYKPAYRSGGYALLVTLLENSLINPDKPKLTKEELIEKAQKHAEESLLQPAINSYYNGWSNMSTLLKKGLVKSVRLKKVEYSLTKEGKAVAMELLADCKDIPTANDIIFKNTPISTSNATVEQNSDPILDDQLQTPPTSGNTDLRNVVELTPESFDIILLIDKNETGGLRKKNDPTVAQFNKYPDLKHEYRSLKVGDFTWIAKHKVHQDQELVLPFIVERKRMDDLGASIKDGRFHEQKFRLHKCGINNVLYLVENFGKNTNVGLPIQNLMQAIANTRVQDGFKVQMTDSLTHSARFLAMLTSRLSIRYKARHLRGCDADPKGEMLMTFNYFNKSSAKSKPLTVTETFIKILLQLKGMSVDKALVITKKYPTPNSLRIAYAKCDRKEGESLLAFLKYGDLHRKVGPGTSKAIYQLFSSNEGG